MLTTQDLIAEDNLPLREVPLEEIRAKIAQEEVSLTGRQGSAQAQRFWHRIGLDYG